MTCNKKIIAFLLAAQMLLLGASCGKNGGEVKETTGSPAETKPQETMSEETEPEETKLDRTTVSDDLPEISFNDKDFRIIANADALFQLVAEDQTGEATNDVIYDRNKRVEDRFDIKLSAFEMNKETQDVICMYAMVDEHFAEIGDVWSRMGLSLAADSLCLDWMEIPHIDWDKPWWNKAANENGIIHGRMFNVTGEMAVTAMQYTWAIAFNMDLMKDYEYTSDELYGYVLDGEWTLDKMIEVCSGIYKDVDGDGNENSGDIFGYAAFVGIMQSTSGVYGARSMPWVHAIGEKPYTMSADKTSAEITLGTEKVYTALEKLLNFHHNTVGTICYSNNNNDSTNEATALKDFISGTVGMYPTTFQSCFTSFIDLPFSYGMLPYPKYDTAQERYYTVPFEAYSVYQIPCTLPFEDYEMVGVIMEALNAESWKTVSLTYYDEAMKGRYSADETTAEIIDLIMESRIFDWGYQVAIFAPGLAKTPFVFACQIQDNDIQLASVLAENWDKAEEALELCISFYSDDYVNPLWN